MKPTDAPGLPLGHEFVPCPYIGDKTVTCHVRGCHARFCEQPESAHAPAASAFDAQESEHRKLHPAVQPASEGEADAAFEIAVDLATDVELRADLPEFPKRAGVAQDIHDAAAKIRALVEQAKREAQCKVVVGFYEDEWPHYSDEWTHELQSPVTAAELNTLIANYKTLAGALVRAEKAERERDEARAELMTSLTEHDHTRQIMKEAALADIKRHRERDAAQAEAKALRERVGKLEEAAHNANGELLMHQDSCRGCRESVLALEAVGIKNEDSPAAPAENAKAGLDTAGTDADIPQRRG